MEHSGCRDGYGSGDVANELAVLKTRVAADVVIDGQRWSCRLIPVRRKTVGWYYQGGNGVGRS